MMEMHVLLMLVNLWLDNVLTSQLIPQLAKKLLHQLIINAQDANQEMLAKMQNVYNLMMDLSAAIPTKTVMMERNVLLIPATMKEDASILIFNLTSVLQMHNARLTTIAQISQKFINVIQTVWSQFVTKHLEDVSPNQAQTQLALQRETAKTAYLQMLANLQFVWKTQLIKLLHANVQLTLVTMEKCAPKILVIPLPENAQMFTLFAPYAHQELNAQRISTAKLGLKVLVMIWNASLLSVTTNLVHVKLFQMDTNAKINSARKHAHQEMLVKNLLALMMLSLRNSSATITERIAMIITHVLSILVTTSKDVLILLTAPLKDVTLQDASTKLTATNMLLTTNSQRIVKMQSVITRPKLAELFWSTTKIATHAWTIARRLVLLLMLVKLPNVLQMQPPNNAAVSRNKSLVMTRTHVPQMFVIKLKDVYLPTQNLIHAKNNAKLIATVSILDWNTNALWIVNSQSVTNQPHLAR
jgi:hypothetical protein